MARKLSQINGLSPKTTEDPDLSSIAPGDTVKKRRVFKVRKFARWSDKAAVADDKLCEAVAEMADGLIGADLGGHVYKKRVRRPGRGKSAGARVLVGSNLDDRWFFLYGFQKNERDSIDDKELAALKRYAGEFLKMDDRQLSLQVDFLNLTEICREEKKPNTR